MQKTLVPGPAPPAALPPTAETLLTPALCRFEARVVVLDVQIPILKGQQVTIHAHTGAC